MKEEIGNYRKLSEHDYALFGNAIHQARGNIALHTFANQCGYTPRVFQSYVRQEKSLQRTETSLHKIIDPIIENADPKSTITEENLFAAMGYIPKRYVTAAYKHHLKEICLSEKSDQNIGYNYQKLYDSINREMTEQEKKDEEFVQYIYDIAFFAATLPESSIYEIKKRIYKIYGEKTLRKMLREFHAAAENAYQDAIDELIAFLKDENIAGLKGFDEEVIHLYFVLKDLLSDY